MKFYNMISKYKVPHAGKQRSAAVGPRTHVSEQLDSSVSLGTLANYSAWRDLPPCGAVDPTSSEAVCRSLRLQPGIPFAITSSIASANRSTSSSVV